MAREPADLARRELRRLLGLTNAGNRDIIGNSVRVPAAWCGIVGPKTTWGRIPTAGVWPLAPSLDTVGPLARTVAEVATGMRLLEPGWTPAPRPARVVGRLRIDGVDAGTEGLVDSALDAAQFTVRTVRLRGWEASYGALDAIILAELWRTHHALLTVRVQRGEPGRDTVCRRWPRTHRRRMPGSGR